jgi:RimJ/RimL family protein N-acetyltransferase
MLHIRGEAPRIDDSLDGRAQPLPHIKRQSREQRKFPLEVRSIFLHRSSMSDQEFLTQDPKQSETFELQPRLVGDLLEVRPLRPEDWESLFAVASDPLIWEQHPAQDRYEEEVFKEFFREALESGGALVVIDRKTQKIIGSSRYFGFEPTKREIEIGWTFLARSHWGGRYNGELKRLMLDHAFRFVESVVFLIGPTNVRSQKAVEKIGGVLIEGREKTNPDGTTVERVVYQIKKPTVSCS